MASSIQQSEGLEIHRNGEITMTEETHLVPLKISTINRLHDRTLHIDKDDKVKNQSLDDVIVDLLDIAYSEGQ
jgi:hypothetical protein